MRGCAFVRGAEGWQKAPWAVQCPFKKMGFGQSPNYPAMRRVRQAVSDDTSEGRDGNGTLEPDQEFLILSSTAASVARIQWRHRMDLRPQSCSARMPAPHRAAPRSSSSAKVCGSPLVADITSSSSASSTHVLPFVYSTKNVRCVRQRMSGAALRRAAC